MSRLRLASAVRRDVRIVTRWTPPEWKRVCEVVARLGVTRSAFVRQQTLTGARRRHPAPAGLNPELRRELGRIGNNLNQIARALNIGEGVKPAKLEAVIYELGSLLERVR